jgi:hypothetical protein
MMSVAFGLDDVCLLEGRVEVQVCETICGIEIPRRLGCKERDSRSWHAQVSGTRNKDAGSRVGTRH